MLGYLDLKDQFFDHPRDPNYRPSEDDDEYDLYNLAPHVYLHAAGLKISLMTSRLETTVDVTRGDQTDDRMVVRLRDLLQHHLDYAGDDEPKNYEALANDLEEFAGKFRELAKTIPPTGD